MLKSDGALELVLGTKSKKVSGAGLGFLSAVASSSLYYVVRITEYMTSIPYYVHSQGQIEVDLSC